MEAALQSKDLGEDSSVDQFRAKMGKVEQAAKLLFRYEDYVTEARWNEAFDLPMEMYLAQVADANMRIFLGKGFPNDYKLTDHRRPMTEIRKVFPNPDAASQV